jgi:Zn-dependent protease with chaperone function
VAAVLAHEIGHVAHRHTTRHLLQSSFMALGSVLLLGDVSAVAGLAATVPTVLLHNAYSRDFEREADRFAFDLLQRAGRSPREFAQALTRLEDAASRHGGSDVPSFVSTHPSTKERVRAARDATP